MNTRTLPLGRMSLMMVALAAIGVIALSAAVLIRPGYAFAGDKWFVCKYVGTPGVDETLQTGNNPISVADNAISKDGEPVVVGSFFADDQGRSYVLALDTGQPEPSVNECPPPNTVVTIATTLSANPVAIGVAVHDSALLSGQTATAGGTVTYSAYAGANTCSGTDLLNSTVTVAAGIVPDSADFTPLNAGTYSFQATYSGDANNNNSVPVSSPCSTEQLVVNPNAPTVATIIVPAGPVAIGTIAHDTAQISGATATAGGTISYALYSNNDCTGLLANLTPTVNAVLNHIAPDSKAFTFTGAGTFYFYAVYSGDPNNTGNNSGCAAEPYTVNPAEIVVLTGTGTPAPEIVVLAGSGTPAPSVANTALSQNGVSPIPTIAFSLILLASLGALAFANVKTVRSRS